MKIVINGCTFDCEYEVFMSEPQHYRASPDTRNIRIDFKDNIDIDFRETAAIIFLKDANMVSVHGVVVGLCRNYIELTANIDDIVILN